MPGIPYPEFIEFKLQLASRLINGDDPVTGVATLGLNDKPNCVKDILIACRCVFRYKDETGNLVTSLVYEEISRNATPFDDEGVPAGTYEFPFSFTISKSLPPSVNVVGGWDDTTPCKLWYEVRAYVMHAESHPTLERKHLRTSVKFQRCSRYTPCKELIPHIQKKKNYSLNSIEVKASLSKDVYVHGEDILVKVTTKNELIRGIQSIKVFVRQTLVVYENNKPKPQEYTVVVASASASKTPVKRHCEQTEVIPIRPSITKKELTESYNVYALAGALDPEAPVRVASTCSRTSQEGVDISYHVSIHFSVPLSNDVVLSIPFVLSDSIPDAQLPPAYNASSLDTSTAAERKAAEAARYASAADDWIQQPPDEDHFDYEDENNEELHDLPSYTETLENKQHYRQLRASKVFVSKPGVNKVVELRQSVFLPEGSTDQILGHDLNSDEDLTRSSPAPLLEPVDEDVENLADSIASSDPFNRLSKSFSSQAAVEGSEAIEGSEPTEA